MKAKKEVRERKEERERWREEAKSRTKIFICEPQSEKFHPLRKGTHHNVTLIDD